MKYMKTFISGLRTRFWMACTTCSSLSGVNMSAPFHADLAAAVAGVLYSR